ncbi:hypothetical protein AURDEDRAFT_113795 [Auricularia subglabra TFB-10046 SS5]|nr:hypothetical protein AURDEDRAFT_113795 [Auricularia subglabra TFB-10046 SS5]
MSTSEAYTSDAPFFPLPARADAALPNQVWYFEGVSAAPGSRASIQVVFMAGLPFAGAPMPFYAMVSGTREDGSRLTGAFLPAASARVEDGNGTWDGAGGWTVEQDGEKGKTWIVKFGKEGQDGSGTLRLRSSVPTGHFPCADENQVVSAGQLRTPLLVNGGIGWSTTVPGATVEVEATMEGKELKFDGTGFHDTNFAKGVWSGVIDDWYWARGQAGPYSFVVYHFVPLGTSAWHTSAALWDAREAAPLVDAWTGSAAWAAGQHVTCTPGGAWPTTPAEIRADEELRLQVEFRAGGRRWVFDVASAVTVVSGAHVPYGRWTARTSGGAVDGDGKQEKETGTGSFDWFKFQ